MGPRGNVTDAVLYVTFGLVCTVLVVGLNSMASINEVLNNMQNVAENTVQVNQVAQQIAHVRPPNIEHLLNLHRMILDRSNDLDPVSVRFLVDFLNLHMNQLPTREDFQALIDVHIELSRKGFSNTGSGFADWFTRNFPPGGQGSGGGTSGVITPKAPK